MSRQHSDTVRAITDLWNAGDRTSNEIEQYFDPAIEMETPLSSVVGEPYRDYAGMERWMSDLDEQFVEWHLGLDEVREVGNQAIAIGVVHARGRASGIPLQFPAATVFDFASDGRITRVCIFRDVNEALAAIDCSVDGQRPGV
jgi:hypothetical protein